MKRMNNSMFETVVHAAINTRIQVIWSKCVIVTAKRFLGCRKHSSLAFVTNLAVYKIYALVP